MRVSWRGRILYVDMEWKSKRGGFRRCASVAGPVVLPVVSCSGVPPIASSFQVIRQALQTLVGQRPRLAVSAVVAGPVETGACHRHCVFPCFLLTLLIDMARTSQDQLHLK